MVSCASFPENDSDEDGMLLVPIVLNREIPSNLFWNCRMNITDSNGKTVKNLVLPSSDTYAYTLLKPGIYFITEVDYIFSKSGFTKIEPNCEVNIPVEIHNGTISVIPQYMDYRVYSKETKQYIRGEVKDMTEEINGMIGSALSEQMNAETWKVLYPEI
jgi:hypothetical protein